MRRSTTLTAAIIAGLMAFTALTMAQNATTRQRTRDATDRDRDQAGRLDDKTTGRDIRASQLIGMNIQNSQDEGVGEVSDVVLNARTGQVNYLAVTYGGFLGVGNKMFAVPFEAFKVRQDPDDADDYVLMLDVTQKQLEGAQGFDEDHWPDFADRSFRNELDKRYGIDRKQVRGQRNLDANVNHQKKK